MIKTYIIAKSTFHKDGQLMVRFELYRRILEDGTDLRWSYNIGREPLLSEDGPYNDIEQVRLNVVHQCLERGIHEADIDYVY